jgi:gluconate 2-dehydrogenase gamma chain
MTPLFASTQPKKLKIYQPKIFSPHEFQTLKVVTETILRDDEMPGAREAKANEFIDFQIKYDPELQERFHDGLLWLDRHSRRLHGRNFVQLKSDERRDIIQCLEVKAKHRAGEERGREFFELAKRYTYMGFYASEEALRAAIPAVPKAEPPKRRRVAKSVEDLPPAN